MTTNARRFSKILERTRNLQTEVDQAKGQLKMLMEELQEKFGCSSVKEAKQLLVKLRKDEENAEQEYTEALNEYEETWSEQLTAS